MEKLINSHILYSCVDKKKRSNEQFVPEHAFGMIISGESHFYTEQSMQVYGEGTIGLIKRNQLIKTTKVPTASHDFRSVNIIFDQEFLHRYAAEHAIKPTQYKGKNMIEVKDNPFIKAYFESLLPYFDKPQQMTDKMARLKVGEALELILSTGAPCHNLLFDFSEPFKIDLESYMNRNYVYNVPLAQFAKLTGRSLATFKRDFGKVFGTPPERWLHQKRLEQAHFLLTQKKQTSSEVYMEVGFENLSHFSSAFKKFFGYTPSSLR